MLNLENWAWADCQLGNIAKRAQQFNLHGEKRKSEGKRRKEKRGREKIGEGRENGKGRGGRKGKKRKGKTRTARIIYICKKDLYIFRNNYNIRNISKVKLEKSQKRWKNL